MIDLENKKVGVIGLSKRTGVATAKFLAENEAEVIATDIKHREELKEEINKLKKYNIEYELEGHGKKTLESDLLVISPGVPLDLPFFNKVKNKNIPLISEIELAYQFTEAKIIAITGTNGKTTTTSLLGKMMINYYGENAKVAGNIGTPLISVAPGLSDENFLIVEVSSFQLETIKEFQPHTSLFLNFTPDHLDRHKTTKNYLEAKKKIFTNQKNDDYAIINLDDETVLDASQITQAKKLYISSKPFNKNGAYIKNGKVYLKNNGNNELIISNKEISLHGKHNLMNVAFAVLAAYINGVEIETIKKTVKNYEPAKHRLEIIYNDKDKKVIVDDSKATNPDAAVKALQTFNDPIILIAGGQDRNANFHKLIQEINKKVKLLILLGETADELHNLLLKTGFENIYKVDNMKNAIKIALNHFNNGDTLMLSPGCPSWDMYESYKVRGEKFVDELKSQSDFI